MPSHEWKPPNVSRATGEFRSRGSNTTASLTSLHPRLEALPAASWSSGGRVPLTIWWCPKTNSLLCARCCDWWPTQKEEKCRKGCLEVAGLEAARSVDVATFASSTFSWLSCRWWHWPHSTWCAWRPDEWYFINITLGDIYSSTKPCFSPTKSTKWDISGNFIYLWAPAWIPFASMHSSRPEAWLQLAAQMLIQVPKEMTSGLRDTSLMPLRRWQATSHWAQVFRIRL